MVRTVQDAAPAALPASVEITLAAVVAHAWAEGGLPEVPWLLGLGALTYVVSRHVLRGQVPFVAAVLGMGVAQLGLHVFLALMSPHAHGEAGGELGLTWPMLLAHLVSTLVTGLVWEVRRRVVGALLHLTAPVPAVPRLRTSAHRAVVVLTQRCLLLAAPRRGPPVAPLCA